MLIISSCLKSDLDDLEAEGNKFEAFTEYFPLTVDTIYFNSSFPSGIRALLSVNEEHFNEYQNSEDFKTVVIRDGEVISTNSVLVFNDPFVSINTWYTYEFRMIQDGVMSKKTEPISVYSGN